MAWTYLLIACLCEIAWSGIGLKFAGGGRSIVPAVLTFVGNNFALFFVMMATKNLPISVAYPIMVGTGIAGTAAIGIVFFDEPGSALKILCIVLIFAGVIGLKILEKSA